MVKADALPDYEALAILQACHTAAQPLHFVQIADMCLCDFFARRKDRNAGRETGHHRRTGSARCVFRRQQFCRAKKGFPREHDLPRGWRREKERRGCRARTGGKCSFQCGEIFICVATCCNANHIVAIRHFNINALLIQIGSHIISMDTKRRCVEY